MLRENKLLPVGRLGSPLSPPKPFMVGFLSVLMHLKNLIRFVS
jgi:hypothetical protein